MGEIVNQVYLTMLFVLAITVTLLGFWRKKILWPLFTLVFWWSVYVETSVLEFAVAAIFFSASQVIMIVRGR